MFTFVQAHLLKTQQILFLALEIFFSVLVLKKIQLQRGINYSIVLSANENAECNKLLNKTKTMKHRCEK